MNKPIPMLTLGVQGSSTYSPATNFDHFNLSLIPNSNCGSDVRSVHCGGTFFAVRLWPKAQYSPSSSLTEEIYVKQSAPKGTVSNYLKLVAEEPPNASQLYWVDYREAIVKLNLGNCFEVKHVHCVQCFILLQMKNNLILAFEAASGNCIPIEQFVKKDIGVREIVSGPLSLGFLVCGSDDMLYYFNADTATVAESVNLHLDLKNRKYVKAALSGRSVFVVYEKEDGSHGILTQGDDQFLTQNGQSSIGSYTELITPFTGRVNQIKCGYFHTCILLENGDVWMCGYNAYSQCGVTGRDQHFIKLDFPSFPLIHQGSNGLLFEGNSESYHVFKPTSITCSSIATLFINQFGFILIGDPVTSHVDKYTFRTEDRNAKVECIYHAFGKEKNFDFETDSVESGGWHFVVYKKRVLESKCLKYLHENMKKISQNPLETFSDVSVTSKQ